MKKRLVSLLLAALCLCLCACGSVYEKEYVLIEDYVPTQQNISPLGDRVTVHNLLSLRQAIRSIVTAGDSSGVIVFDPDYDGEITEDISSACWQLRTQDALCAYCVANISYELNKIVTYYEAQVSISYSPYGEAVENIIRLPYSTGLEALLKEAISQGNSRVAVLIDRSSLSAEDMENLAAGVYLDDPISAPRMPTIRVNMFSSTNMPRLYEINLIYGMSAEELASRKAELAGFDPFADISTFQLDQGERALLAYEYVVNNIRIEEAAADNSIYSALILSKTGTEGASLAYVELCRQLGIDCRIVYGQRNWQDHCWNIVNVRGDFYHVDASLGKDAPTGLCFLRTDEQFWESYRWDVASYPVCAGPLSYEAVIGAVPADAADAEPAAEAAA